MGCKYLGVWKKYSPSTTDLGHSNIPRSANNNLQASKQRNLPTAILPLNGQHNESSCKQMQYNEHELRYISVSRLPNLLYPAKRGHLQVPEKQNGSPVQNAYLISFLYA